MNFSQISLRLFRNANRISLVVLGVASIVFAAPPGKEPDLMPLRGGEGYGGDIAARLQPLPETYRVQEHYDDRYAGRVAGTSCEEKVIYANTKSLLLFRPGRHRPLADDILTTLVVPCALNTLRVRVNGGVENGNGMFQTAVSLYDGCPSAGGELIPGTQVLFSQLSDDFDVMHDLIVNFRDRGVCADGSTCVVSVPNCADASPCAPDPFIGPTSFWLWVRFDTDTAALTIGSPPSIGFSTDKYDDSIGACTAWFGGWPSFPYASFGTTMTALIECETHFLAYLAANPLKPVFLPTDIPFPNMGTPTTRLGDDIRLSVDDCILSAYELGMKGDDGPYEMSVDLRLGDINVMVPETQQVFSGRGDGELEVTRFLIPPEIEVSIHRLDQPIYITWAANRSNTGVLEVNHATVGFSDPEFFAFDTNLNNPDTWNTLLETNFSPAVFYAAVFCRGEMDSDGDGFLDECDACLDSNLAELIEFEECPTGVPNILLDDGCTMSDVLTECSVGAHSHGEWTACVARQANEWRRQGLLSGKDVGRIAHCAGTSNEGRPSKRIKDARSRGSQ